MIAHLRGAVHKLAPGAITVDINGVGYAVAVPLDVWDAVEEGMTRLLWISTYVREDRFDLYGFLDLAGRTLFEELIEKPGIGPRLGLELCAVPRTLLRQAIRDQDAALLTTIKGIGKKTAEKLLLELKSLEEKHPGIFEGGTASIASSFDQDAIDALAALGYDSSTILAVLKSLPSELSTTEQRVEAALRTL